MMLWVRSYYKGTLTRRDASSMLVDCSFPPREITQLLREREALAMVWDTERFRGYLEGAAIQIAAEHQPLKLLLGLKMQTGRLARWDLKLQPYNLNIVYTHGKMNVMYNALSCPNYTVTTRK